MLLKDMNELWGIPLEDIRRKGKKYNIYSLLIYLLDMFLIIFCGLYMFKNGSSFSICVFVTICVTLLSFLLMNIFINPEKWRAYIFFKKHKNAKILEMRLYLGKDNMKSVLYCSNYSRKKLNATVCDYKELMLSACREDTVFSKRLGNLLYKFTVDEDGMELVNTYMIKKGKKYFLIGFNDDLDSNLDYSEK